MPVYERSTVVDAPLAAVWAFHARIEGLLAVTPSWLRLRVERVDRPPETNGDELVAGTRIRLSVRPFGIGPRRHWTSVVRESDHRADAALLRDEMIEGPFPRWIHTHHFSSVTGPGNATEDPTDRTATRVRDVIEYRLPGGRLGRALGPLARVGFGPMFRFRHRRTRRLLEGASAGS